MAQRSYTVAPNWDLILHVDGLKPKSSPRARAGQRGVFLPPEYQQFKQAIRDAISSQGARKLTGWLQLQLRCVFPLPKKQTSLFPPIGDWDNLAKTCADAIQGICFDDDRQIVDGRCIKVYGTTPGYEIRIRQVQSVEDLEW